MEVKIMDKEGRILAERHYLPMNSAGSSKFLLNNSEHGVYIVNIIIDGIVKTKKMRIK